MPRPPVRLRYTPPNWLLERAVERDAESVYLSQEVIGSDSAKLANNVTGFFSGRTFPEFTQTSLKERMMGDDTQRKIFFTYLGQKGREIKDHTDARELLNASNRPTWPELDPSVLAYFEYWDDAGKNLGITGKPETDFKRGITRALSVAIGVARSARGIGPDEVVPMSAVRALEPEALQKLVGSDALRLVFGIGGPGPDELPAQ